MQRWRHGGRRRVQLDGDDVRRDDDVERIVGHDRSIQVKRDPERTRIGEQRIDPARAEGAVAYDREPQMASGAIVFTQPCFASESAGMLAYVSEPCTRPLPTERNTRRRQRRRLPI
jgi:hypothetical protein